MKKMNFKILFYTLSLSSVILLSGCNNGEDKKDGTSTEDKKEKVVENLSEEELENQIETLKSEMKNDDKQDLKKLNKLLALCIDLVNAYPENENAGYCLDLAAQLSYAKGNVKQSVGYYERLINEYPNYEDIEYAYFMYANHLDLDLRKIDEATKAYEEFIEKYPNSQFVPEAKMRLENIDMSMEDIISKNN